MGRVSPHHHNWLVPTTSRPSLASFWHDLPRAGKLLLSTVIIDFIGTGLVLPFNVVYLHEVRQFELDRVGLLLAIPAVVGMLVVGPAGVLIDRIGARQVMLSALSLQMLGLVLMAFSTTELSAAAAFVLLGLTGGGSPGRRSTRWSRRSSPAACVSATTA